VWLWASLCELFGIEFCALFDVIHPASFLAITRRFQAKLSPDRIIVRAENPFERTLIFKK
jgi:hypothetical protein